MMEEQSIEKKLLKLLNDMEEIEDELSEWLDDTNIFQILKLSRTEIRHSNFLAYLLSPNESHKWQDKLFKALLKTVIEENDSQHATFDYFDLVLNDYSDLIVYREYKNIDLFIVSEKNKLVMAIENKIGSIESEHQLKKYQKYIDTHYIDYTKVFVFLTPEREEASNNTWYLLSYYEIIASLERLIKIYGLETKIKFLVDDYLKSLRRDVIMDEKLQKICNRIYSQHHEALDLIFENKPDNLSVMSELYGEAITKLEKEGLLIANSYHSGKSIVRFETKEMNQAFPRLSTDYRGGWGNHKAYSFEILNKDAKTSGRIKIAFTGKIAEDKRLVLEKTLSHLDNRTKKSNWEWWTVGNWRIKKVNQNFVENIIARLGEEDREVIVEEITDSLRNQMEEINDYCNELLSKYYEISNE